jgi:hypothetical protein
MTAPILALLLSLPPFSQEPVPEPDAAREARLRVQASAIWQATETRPRGVSRLAWAGALVALGKHESRFAAYVSRDQCETGPYKCDDGRAKGPFQAHRSACPKLWALEGGSVEWHRYAARCASGLLTGAYMRCRTRAPSVLAGSFSGYRGASCTWAPSVRRARTAQAFAARLGG